MLIQEALLGIHLNPLAYILLLAALVAAIISASTHDRATQGSGLDNDDSPSGWAAISFSLMLVAVLISGSATGIRSESRLLADKAFSKYGVTYMDQAAHSKVAHRVTAKPTVNVGTAAGVIAVNQLINPVTHEVVLTFPGNGKELPLRDQ